MSSTSSTLTMESIKDHPLMPARVVVAYDATKDPTEIEFSHTIHSIRSRGDILHGGDTLMFLGVLSKVPHPMGYQMQARPESFLGITHVRLVEEEVSKKVDFCVRLLQKSAEEYDSEGLDIEVKITAGTPTRKVVLQEVITSNATWLILDRHLRRDLRFYLKQISCKVAIIEDNLSMVVVRPSTISDTDKVEPNLFISLAKNVPLLAAPNEENTEQFIMSCKSDSASMGSLENSDRIKSNLLPALKYYPQDHNISSHHELSPNSEDKSGRHAKGGSKPPISPQVIEKLRRKPSGQRSNDTPVLCIGCGMKTKPDIKASMKFSFSEIQLATNDFSKDNLLGEGGYGHVYKGRLKDGQFIAAKLRKEASTQGFAEFLSEIYVLSFARHKNIVMLLGYCCKENLNILVYEYICNKSLEWHLFDSEGDVLEWHRRHSIAIGTAKGLRFLHEECRGSPIIHCDMRPSNILLTHDFVPMCLDSFSTVRKHEDNACHFSFPKQLGDFGLAKRRTDEGNTNKRILGTLGYLAPEYAENGIVSVKTDVYSIGIILIQLMSGRKVVDSNRLDQQHSLRQWAIPLIQRLALHELVDPRIQDSYDTYELYLMVRAAYLCVQTNPEMRPTMGEVLRLLEGESDHLNQLADQFVPHFSK